jgi:hypothetical protein
MSNKEIVLLFELFECILRTGVDTVGFFTSSTNKGIGSEFYYGVDTIIYRMIKITALNSTIFAFTGGAHIEIYVETHVGT